MILFDHDTQAEVEIRIAIIKNTALANRHIGTRLIESPWSLDIGSPSQTNVVTDVVCEIQIVNG